MPHARVNMAGMDPTSACCVLRLREISLQIFSLRDDSVDKDGVAGKTLAARFCNSLLQNFSALSTVGLDTVILEILGNRLRGKHSGREQDE